MQPNGLRQGTVRQLEQRYQDDCHVYTAQRSSAKEMRRMEMHPVILSQALST